MSALKVPADLRKFAAGHEGVDAVIQRIGADTWDLLLIDGEGNWTRAVYLTKEQCRQVAAHGSAHQNDRCPERTHGLHQPLFIATLRHDASLIIAD